MAGVTEQQILDAINTAKKLIDESNPNGALTAQEICKATGMGHGWTMKKLQILVEKDVVKVTRVRRTRIDGNSQLTPAYYVRKETP